MKNKIMFLGLTVLVIATPLFSINRRSLSAYNFACGIVAAKVPIDVVERKLGRTKAIYDNTEQVPDWMRKHLPSDVLINNKYMIYLFSYEGLPYFQTVVLYESKAKTPFMSVIWGRNQVKVFKCGENRLQD